MAAAATTSGWLWVRSPAPRFFAASPLRLLLGLRGSGVPLLLRPHLLRLLPDLHPLLPDLPPLRCLDPEPR